MINGAGDPQLQNPATLANQQQQTSVKTTGEPPAPPSVTSDSTMTIQASTIVTLGTKQNEPITYSSLTSIRKPPPETQATLDASAPDDTQSNITGGIRKPPP